MDNKKPKDQMSSIIKHINNESICHADTELNSKPIPPVEKWTPPYCGEIDIRIAANGDWYYNGSIMGRQKLVDLFSTVLRLDEDKEYYLVTPVEKVKIKVEVAPLYVVDFTLHSSAEGHNISFLTKTGDRFYLDDKHPLMVEKNDKGEPIPLVLVRQNLKALISRPVFYQLMAMTEDISGKWYLRSGNHLFLVDS